MQTLERTIRQAAILDDEDVAYRTALRLSETCEQAVLLARSLPACTGIPHVFFDMEQQTELQTPVEIGFTAEGWFSLRMPMLMPKKERGSAAFVRMLLLPALRRFFQGKPPVRINPCVLVFRHVYSKDRPDRALRDHDNIETNMHRQRDRRTDRDLCGTERGVLQVAVVGKIHARGRDEVTE